MFIRFFVMFFVLCGVLAPYNVGAQAPKPVYGAVQTTLSNGLTLVVVPNNRVPAVTHMIWYKVGAAQEPWGMSGIAHYLEHLMFKGTPTVGEGKLSETVQRMGGTDNAFTSWDFTAYFQTVPKEGLRTVMQMEADRMTQLTPSLPAIFSEKQVVIEERRQTTDSDPGAVLAEQARQALFPNHPYGRPILGWMSEMATLRWVDALWFYKRYYTPNNAIVIISGDITMPEAKALAEDIYGPIKARPIPASTRLKAQPLQGDVRVTHTHPSVRQKIWQTQMRVPSARQNADAARVLTVLDDVLGGATGHLYQDVVVRQKLATSIDTAYNGTARDDGVFTVYATPADGVTLDRLETAIKASLAALARKGFTDKEVQTAITRLQDQADFARDSLAGPAMTLGYGLAVGIPLDILENWPASLTSVTPQHLQKALQDRVLAAQKVTSWLLPEAQDTGKGAE